MRNYLLTLGWAPPGDREIVPWEVILDTFRLEDVNSAPAFFDEKKLLAFNDEYVRALPLDEFVAACQPWLAAAGRALAGRAVRRRRVRAAGAAGAGARKVLADGAVLRRLRLPGRGARRSGVVGQGHGRRRRRRCSTT